MSFSFIALATGGSNSSATTLDTSSSLNVQAGDVLVAWVKHEGASTTIAIAKNSGSPANTFTFDAGDKASHSNGDLYGSMGYVLNASADASATFRLTLGASRGFRRLLVGQFRPSGGSTVTKDGSNKGSGDSAAPNSGNVTTTGTDTVAFGGYGEYAGTTTSSEQIGGVSATEPTGSPVSSYTSVWYRLLTATMTNGAATATISSNEWICGLICITATADGGGGSTIKTFKSLLGVGL